MNIVSRQLFISIVWGFLMALMLSFLFFITFPLKNWSDLWLVKVINLPFIMFVFLLVILLSGFFGLWVGWYWKNLLQSIGDALFELEQGRYNVTLEGGEIEEVTLIHKRMEKIQRLMLEQTKLSQRLANEKAEDHEKKIQETISQERNRLARELHDSVSQQLFAASMLMSAVNESRSPSNEREEKQLKLVEQTIQQSQLEMRALLLHLRPVALKGKSLQEGMEDLLGELIHKVPIKISSKIEEFPMDKGIEDHLFRILQESLSNALRHSKANHIEVLLIRRDQFIILRIVDDGIGFEVDSSKSGSYGLQNMHERALEIGGNLKIISVKEQGTRLEVKVPVIEEEGVQND